MVEAIALFVRADMGADQEEFLVFDFRIRIRQVGSSAPERLDLGAGEDDSGFESFMDMIIVPRSTVFGDDLYALIFSRQGGSPLFVLLFFYWGQRLLFEWMGLPRAVLFQPVWFGVVRCRLPE